MSDSVTTPTPSAPAPIPPSSVATCYPGIGECMGISSATKVASGAVPRVPVPEMTRLGDRKEEDERLLTQGPATLKW